MLRLTLGSLLLIVASSTAGPVIGRAFRDANCGFSLPDQDWEWLDPKRAPPPAEHAIAFARNRSGLMFWLKVRPIAPENCVGPETYENWARQWSGKYNWTKEGGKHIEFKGVPAYQFNARHKDNKSAGRFLILFADNRSYVLVLETSHAEVGPEADAVFDRFTFLDPPHPMLERHEDRPESIGDNVEDKIAAAKGWVGESAAGLGGFGLVVLVLFGAWLVIRMRG
jgi:hypothetical protein